MSTVDCLEAFDSDTQDSNPPKPASSTFPCNLPTTICVTSCNKAYGWSSDFAAYGRKVDIIGPGEDIPVAIASSDDATTIKSGECEK